MCWRGSRRQALRDLRKGLDRSAQKAGTRDDGPTGPAASTSPRGKIGWVRLVRPSVQLPAGTHGCAPYKDFGRHGKGKRSPDGLLTGGSPEYEPCNTCLYDIQLSRRKQWPQSGPRRLSSL